MQKIISLFKRNYDGDRLIYNEIVPGAEWVIQGEGIATEKFDGTACMIKNGNLYKRYDRRPSKTKLRAKKKGLIREFTENDFTSAPVGWTSCEDNPDQNTGHWPGWLLVTDRPKDKYHVMAYNEEFEDGTYELVGPKVQGNPYNLGLHQLWKHGRIYYLKTPRTYQGLREWFKANIVEGIVWHHPDGRMVKIKRKDFGFDWPPKTKSKET